MSRRIIGNQVIRLYFLW